MTTSVDNFKSKLNDFRNQLKKLKSEYKLEGAKTTLTNEQKGNLKFNLQKLLRDLSIFKKEYLDSNYRSVLSEFEDSNRKDELGEVITECETLIKTYCKGEYESNIKEEDYKDQEFDNPYEQMQYQEKKLKEQDELINNIISTNDENKVIGKEVKNNLKEQNKKINKIGVTLEETNRDAKRLNEKFVDMILDSSFWKLYCLIGFLALVLIWIWL
jgi:hypothetical protein